MGTFFKIFSLVLLALTLASPIWAIDLDTARNKKIVEEMDDGFIKPAKPDDKEAKALADEVNAKRKKAYEDIAKQNGLTVEQVGAQAAKKIKEKKAEK